MPDPSKDSNQADTFSLVGHVCFFSGVVLTYRLYDTYIPYVFMGVGMICLLYSWMKSPNDPRW